MKRHIDVTFEALGQSWRVVGAFSPAVPARTYGPPERCHDAEPAEWLDVRVSMVIGEYETPDLSELLDSLQAPGRIGSALDHVRDMAELTWQRERDVAWEAA